MDQEQPKKEDPDKKDMWSSMLDNVASGKRLPEKNVLVLGKFSTIQFLRIQQLMQQQEAIQKHRRNS